jgi:hypothetical protein
MMEHTFQDMVLILLLFPLPDLTNLPLPCNRDRQIRYYYFQPHTILRYTYVSHKTRGVNQGICRTSDVM